jgi:hypothetical protein
MLTAPGLSRALEYTRRLRWHFFRVFERSLIVGTAQTRRDLLEILPRPGRAEVFALLSASAQSPGSRF